MLIELNCLYYNLLKVNKWIPGLMMTFGVINHLFGYVNPRQGRVP